MELIVQSVQKAVATITPWLVGTAVGFFVLWLIMLCYKAKPFAKELKWFFSLTPWHKFIVVCVFSFFTLWGGSKERGILPSGLIDDISSTMTRVVEAVQPRSLPEEISTNALAVTEFAVDTPNQTVTMEVTCATNLFDYTDSRYLDIFMSTNLANNHYLWIRDFPMPMGTNSHVVSISESAGDTESQTAFTNAFGDKAFFIVGADIDSDGDGLTDTYETRTSFTNPLKADTDGDGIPDGLELSSWIGTNPLLYDTDGDGVGDGDEIAAGSNPLTGDSDGDGLSDAAELGSMTACVDDNFLWFGLSDATGLIESSSTSYGEWPIALSQAHVINDISYTNAMVQFDGTVHLLCPTNVNGWASECDYGTLSNSQYSSSHVTIALCGTSLYAKTDEWGSQILHGAVRSDGKDYTVVEYRNIGLQYYSDTKELITCQLIIPHSETNTIYVSYLCASNTFRSVEMVAGVQCGWMPSPRDGEDYYNLSWPIAADFPPDGLTIKYSIGMFTDPTKADTDGDGLSDRAEISVHGTNPLNPDTDGDGLGDGEEIASSTNPHIPDTDGDGLQDGTETEFGSDPLVPDTDEDGVDDFIEYRIGSNPTTAHSDEDGWSDLEELGYIAELPQEEFMWLDLSEGQNLLGNNVTINSGSWPIAMGGDFYVNEVCHTNARVCLDGMVYLLNPTNSSSSNYSDGFNYGGGFSNSNFSATHTALSGYNANMYAKTAWGSALLHGTVSTNGHTYKVVEYRNIGHYSYQNTNDVLLTYQLIFPMHETNVFYVSYLHGDALFETFNPLVGMQCPTMKSIVYPNQKYSLSWKMRPGVFDAPLTLKFFIGTGTHPAKTDTDGDGLSDSDEILVHRTNPRIPDCDGDGLFDGAEIISGTNPFVPDSDGDGIPDGWEVQNGLNPHVDDSCADSDSDGLSNFYEYWNSTDPYAPDTDYDELPDVVEAAWLSTSAGIPWFDMTGATTISPNTDVGSALYACELPFTNRIAALAVSLAVADVNGLIYLGNSATTNGLSSKTSGQDMAGCRSFPSIAIAPYWTNLKLRTSLGSAISHKKVNHSGQNYFVLQYSRIGTSSGSPNNEVSFQVSIPETSPSNIVYVKYGTLVDGRGNSSSYNVSVGAQAFDNLAKLPVSYAVPDQTPVTNGMAIAYHFGCGSDPVQDDTDDDGVRDDIELLHGSNPRNADTDGDGMNDEWEIQNGTDPCFAWGRDGPDGDFDGDYLSNDKEREYETNMSVPDTDNDGVVDGLETGSVFVTNAIPWLVFDEYEDVTTAITSNYWRCVSCPIPVPLHIQGEVVTNLTISANGIVFLNKSGYANSGNTTSGSNFSRPIDGNSLVLAPYLHYAYIRSDIPGRRTTVKYGTATYNGEGFLLVEYLNSYYDTSLSQTNSISFQMAIPTKCPDRAYSRYLDVVGQYMDGRKASIGMQTFDGKWLHSWCYNSRGKVGDGLALEFLFGVNSNPLVADSDDDGLSDGQEVSIGTSPAKKDTDGDGLPDGWEVQHNLNPSSICGNDGDAGDPDGDGVDNLNEYEMGTNPNAADTDSDGLSDGEEAVCVSFATPLPWLEFTMITNLTGAIADSSGCITIDLPSPVAIQHEIVTNITIDVDGVVFFNKAGYVNPEWTSRPDDFDDGIANVNCLTVAPYWDWFFMSDEAAPSSVKLGTATVGVTGYYVLEYKHLYRNLNSYETNSISFQVAFPTGRVDRIHVRYADLVGDELDGRCALIGFQSFDAVEGVTYCSSDRNMVYEDLGLTFVVGYGSDPTKADTDGDGIADNIEVWAHGSDPRFDDTDGDGLSDQDEITFGTSIRNPDSDGDGLLDGWEIANGFNPLSQPNEGEADGDADGDGLTNLQEQVLGSNPRNPDTDGDELPDKQETTHGTDILNPDTDNDGLTDKQEVNLGYDPLDPDMDRDGMPDGWEASHGLDPRNSARANGAFGDPDRDGLSNIDEYLNGTNPHSPDTDGDGVSDRIEVERGADPTDPSDGGQTPPPELFRTLTFNIYGDWAAWEMQIDGLGPEDTRTRCISMGAPDAAETSTLKMRKGNSYRLSMRWLNCDGHDDNMSPWYCWQALIDGLPGQASFDHNYSEGICARLPQRNNIVVGNGWIAENEDGLLTSHVHASRRNSHGGSGAGNVAQGLSATLYVLDDPSVVPDYDRNGKINDDDIDIAEAGNTTFRFWINDDNDSGDLNEGKKDCPGAGKNGQDKKVNGRSDLLDFTPVLLDVSKVFPPGTPDFIKERVSWKLESSVVNAVWTSLPAANAGAFHKTDCGATFGPSLSQNAHEAIVTKLAGGKELPDGFAQIMQDAGGKGVVMIEGCASGSSLKLKGYIDDAQTAAVEGELKINISSVEEMYRWMNLRMVCGDASGRSSCLDEPTNRPDAECDGRHFVFVHGYNVNYRSARGWSAEMFKRLWQAGSQSMFTAVDWYGNESQIWPGVPFLGGESLDYYINVRHALDSAPNFSTAVNALSGDKVMLAHSLGNMLVSEAAKSYLLNYTKYYMLNAAVPIEAYDGTSMAREMIEHGWTDISPEKWAARWYENFHDPADLRRDLKWKGRFAGIHHAVNCYSLTEEVLNNATTNGWGGVWSVQELFKGTSALHLAPGNCEGGWGYNGERTNLAGLLTDFAKTNVFSDTELIMSPIFRKFDNATLHQTNLISIAQTELNKVMGDGIPAVSFAAGANPIQNVLAGSIELSPDGLPYWPSKRIANQRRQWHHSDICNVAFFYVNFIFNKIVKGENQ